MSHIQDEYNETTSYPYIPAQHSDSLEQETMPELVYHREENRANQSDASYYNFGLCQDIPVAFEAGSFYDSNRHHASRAYQRPENMSAYDGMYSTMPCLPSAGAGTTQYYPPVDEPKASSIGYASPGSNYYPAAERQNIMYRNDPRFSDAPEIETTVEGISTSGSGSSESSTLSVDRPVPAKTAFMCFKESQSGEITKRNGWNEDNGVVKAVAKAWHQLSKDERNYWEGVAGADKIRYSREKELYSIHKKGTLVKKLRAKKNPLAPKRPMSAFLMYAQTKRKILQAENPDLPNADISRLLGESWNHTSQEEKTPFLEREKEERKIYRLKMDSWKNDQKLHQSYKTPSSRKRNHNDTDSSDQREDCESTSGFDRQHVSTSRLFSSVTSAYHPAHHYYYGPIHYDGRPQDGPNHQVCNQDSGHSRYSYPRPSGNNLHDSFPTRTSL